MSHDAHIREKAIRLRTDHNMTLEQIVERLQLPKTTIYGWIKHIPIPRTSKQTEAQIRGTQAMQAKFKAIRDKAYQQGWEEAPTLLRNPLFRDFVVLYLAEGYKRSRNSVAICNSDSAVLVVAYYWIRQFTTKKLRYQIQYHVDQDIDELRQYWANILGIIPDEIAVQRKSNSGKLAGRQFRSVHGVLEIKVNDTQFRAKLQAWMDFLKQQWYNVPHIGA